MKKEKWVLRDHAAQKGLKEGKAPWVIVLIIQTALVVKPGLLELLDLAGRLVSDGWAPQGRLDLAEPLVRPAQPVLAAQPALQGLKESKVCPGFATASTLAI